MEIVEVAKANTEKLGKYIKKNPMMILLGGAAVLAVFYLLNKGGSSAGTNNVDTVETVYTDGYNNITDGMNGVTTIYSQSDVEKMIEGIHSYIDESVKDVNSDITKTITDYQTDNDRNIDDLQKQMDKIGDKVESVNEYSSVTKSMDNLSNSLNSFYSKSTNLTTVTKKTTTKKTTTKKNTNKSTKKSASKPSDTYKKATYKGGSIVDGLTSIGIDSSFSNRKKIAKANGIKNYTGTAKQNTTLLSKLKSGQLKKA